MPRRAPLVAACSAAAMIGGMTVSPARADPPGSGYKLIFADEFDGTSLDTLKWVDAYPWGRTHNHDAYMAPQNVIVGGGNLTLRAERQAQGGKPFTSGAISTGYSRFRFNGGYVEARIQLPSTPGSWPAFWGLDDGWPPEADIMEFPLTTDGSNGYPNTDYHTAWHYTAPGGGNAAGAGRVNPASAGNLTTGYHTFGMEWIEDDWVGFYFDGQLVAQMHDDAAVAQMTSMYLILNYAVGGWPGSPSTAQWPANHIDETKVDWVRVWQRPASNATTINFSSTAGSGSWDTAGRWDVMSPRYEDQVACFGANSNSAVSVTWDYSRTIGGLEFDSATAFTIGDSNASLQLARSSGPATIRVATTNSALQSIHARLELYDSVDITNDSEHSLWLSGQIIGPGNLTVNGPGRVVFANNNTYTGNTTIDSGPQGPAVARVTRSNPFGTGIVTIGAGGNSTTARIEIQDNRTVPNAINFNGRNNISVGLLNLSGNNVFSGTITAQAGGGFYIIQSDAGLMSFTGSAEGAGGVAFRAGSGNRTFTFQGDGDGLISGIIENGAGTVGIAKAGNGRWTLSGANTYTGTTTITGGTLAIGAAERIADVSNLHLSGGTFDTGGFSETLGTLSLTADSTIDLGYGASILSFADSSGLTWSGVLTIANWSGDTGGGGIDRVIFRGAAGLTSAQLEQIHFAGFGAGAHMLPGGEIVPATLVPEPAGAALLLATPALFIRRGRRID